VSYFVLQPVYEANVVIAVSEPKIKNSLVDEISLEEYKNLIKDIEIEEELIRKLNLDKPPLEVTPYDLERMITIELPKVPIL
jgi:capsular polysaccharide biosynthesis protein